MKIFKSIFKIEALKTIFILEIIFCPERLPFALNTASTDEIEDAEWICCREPKGKVRKKIQKKNIFRDSTKWYRILSVNFFTL